MKYPSKIFIIFTSILLNNITYWYNEEQIKDFKSYFKDWEQLIWCFNTKTLETKIPTKNWNCFYWKWRWNIKLPPLSHLNIYLEVFNNNVRRIINSMPTENIESWFNPDAWNSHAVWYVQTLRKYKIWTSIKEQLTWKINRQNRQKDTICSKNKWDEYNMMECLYRSHYHFRKWQFYAKKSLVIRQYYLNYFNNKF